MTWQFPPDNQAKTYKAGWQTRRIRERSGCLNLWLGASAFFAAVSGWVLFQILNAIANQPEQPVADGKWLAILLFSIMIVATLIFLRAIVLWRKWGVYGMVVVSLASPFIKQALVRTNASDLIAPFVQLLILFFL